jgi:predicted component of type VI protein secretion system
LPLIFFSDGKPDKAVSQEDDYARAEKAILDAITKVEDKIQKVVQAEVETLFHEQEHSQDLKIDVATKAKKAVEHGVSKVKKAVDDHSERKYYPFEDRPYPYAYPNINQKGKPVEIKDYRILHAIETAEKAVLHAIQEEVDTLFHDVEHHKDGPNATIAQAKSTVKEGVQKASAKVKDTSEHRRGWLANESNSRIEEYLVHDFCLE